MSILTKASATGERGIIERTANLGWTVGVHLRAMSAPHGRALHVRVGLLLSVLALVLLYAAYDTVERRQRTLWGSTLNVAVVLVQRGPVNQEALSRLRARLPVLEARLDSEFHRYHPGGPRPFAFVVYGPVMQQVPPPGAADGSLSDLARHALAQFRFTRDVDARAGVPTRGFDSRVYLVADAPEQRGVSFIEGASEQNGRVGIAKTDLDLDMVDFSLFVTAHELFHTLGASDKYDAAGNVLIPQGLAEPEREPALPQNFVELMAHGRPIDREHEELPTSLDELRVGPYTAEEIGWGTPR